MTLHLNYDNSNLRVNGKKHLKIKAKKKNNINKKNKNKNTAENILVLGSLDAHFDNSAIN